MSPPIDIADIRNEVRDHDSLLERSGPDLLIMLVRALRIAAVHDIHNEAARQVVSEVTKLVNTGLDDFQTLQLQCVGDNIYFNNEFVKLKAAAFESAIQARRLFRRLGINEIGFSTKLVEDDIRVFLERFQAALHGNEPKTFAKEKFPRISVRPIESSPSFNIDRKMELARTYAQLIVVVEETLESAAEGKVVPLARVRRAVQQLAQAAQGQEVLLAGLTRFANPSGQLGLHATAVTSLCLLMGMRLEAGRPDLIALAMSALFHDIGRLKTGDARVEHAHSDEAHRVLERRREAIESALLVASFNQPKEAIERASVAIECALPAAGDRESGLLPSVYAKLVTVACAFDRMVHPGAVSKGLRPDRAMRLLTDHSGNQFDRKVIKLFSSVVGLYPVGSLVRLSGGQTGIVIAIPSDPALVARPTVKVVRAEGRDADYVIELGAEGEALRIVECLDPTEHKLNPTRLLLA